MTLKEHGMGIGKKAKSIGQMAEGKAKETVGKAVGNASLARKGKAEMVKGRVNYAMERGKDKFRH
ncbi:CsbD family protein [Streptomyces sp. NPDC058989]|uniref:CsbD family protein n=2 Tax=unclassified Streptomyces TaxID=2593676 RepID=UPI0036C3551F